MLPQNYDEFLKDFHATVLDASTRMRQMPEAESRRKSAPDDWAPIEILGHLVDSAANNHQRFVRAQFTDDLAFPGYEQNEWVSSQKYTDESWSGLIQLWSGFNHQPHHTTSFLPQAL